MKEQRLKTFRRILQLLIYINEKTTKHDVIKIEYEKLALKFNCSEKTIRRDVKLLADLNLLTLPKGSMKIFKARHNRIIQFRNKYENQLKEGINFMDDVYKEVNKIKH